MSKNSYAAFLNGRDAEVMVREFPAMLVAVVSRLGAEGMKKSLAPGKWTVAEILSHLADTEIAFSFRWRQALALDNHTIQPFDQDLWATHYPQFSAEDALQAFLALRQWNVLLLAQLNSGEWDRPVTHPELGPLTFRTLVEVMAGHDRNHLLQLETMANR